MMNLLKQIFLMLVVSNLVTHHCFASKITLTVTGNVGTKSTMVYRPCNSDEYLTFKVTGENTDNSYLYFYLVNASANGLSTRKSDNQFYIFERDIDWSEVDWQYLRGLPIWRRQSSVYYKIPPVYAVTDNQGNTTQHNTGVQPILSDAYMLPPAKFTNEVIYKDPITFNNSGFPKGLWMAVALLADPAKLNIDDPKTWSAWDAVPIIFGVPWRTANNAICGS